jgi:hypothetical protein
MSVGDARSILVTAIALLLLVSVHRLARRGLITFRYAIGWMGISFVLLFGVLLSGTLEDLAQKFRVSTGVFVSIAATSLLLAITVQLTISISGLQERSRRLVEELAQLRLDLDEAKRENGQHDVD